MIIIGGTNMCDGKCKCNAEFTVREAKIRQLLAELDKDLPAYKFEAVKAEILKVLDERK